MYQYIHTACMRTENQNRERSRATREKLVRLAQEGFISSGFEGLATEGLAERAGVTRGALYHHFRDKRDLFIAVLTGVEERICKEIEERTRDASTPWEGLVAACDAILDRVGDAGVQRVLLVEGKAVMGSEAWWRVHRDHVFGSLESFVSRAIEGGYLPSQPAEPLTQLIWGILSEASEMISGRRANSSPESELRACVMWILHSMVG